MGFADMERLCHAMEDVFQLIRSGNAEISQELGNLLLACSDVLEQMIDDVESGGDTSSKNPDEQVQSLKAWLGARGGKTHRRLITTPGLLRYQHRKKSLKRRVHPRIPETFPNMTSGSRLHPNA